MQEYIYIIYNSIVKILWNRGFLFCPVELILISGNIITSNHSKIGENVV